jgi:hypothetical protein
VKFIHAYHKPKKIAVRPMTAARLNRGGRPIRPAPGAHGKPACLLRPGGRCGPARSSCNKGGSACVIHSSCCPVGGRPASPRKSHSKSQRGEASGDTQLRQATVKSGQVPAERHSATSSDAPEVTGGQGVAGSNPAVPTGS